MPPSTVFNNEQIDLMERREGQGNNERSAATRVHRIILTGLDVEGTEKRKIQQETMSERESDE